MEDVRPVWLLRAAWFLATLPIVAAWLPLPGLSWLRGALLAFAKRGKNLQSNTVSETTLMFYFCMLIQLLPEKMMEQMNLAFPIDLNMYQI